MMSLAQHSKDVRNSDYGYLLIGYVDTTVDAATMCSDTYPYRLRCTCTRMMPTLAKPKGMTEAEFGRLKGACYHMVWRQILREMLEFALSGAGPNGCTPSKVL